MALALGQRLHVAAGTSLSARATTYWMSVSTQMVGAVRKVCGSPVPTVTTAATGQATASWSSIWSWGYGKAKLPLRRSSLVHSRGRAKGKGKGKGKGKERGRAKVHARLVPRASRLLGSDRHSTVHGVTIGQVRLRDVHYIHSGASQV
eukprot:COSAG06_NODE_13388_length_1262_cov_1.003439_3_plen_148_part_00